MPKEFEDATPGSDGATPGVQSTEGDPLPTGEENGGVPPDSGDSDKPFKTKEERAAYFRGRQSGKDDGAEKISSLEVAVGDLASTVSQLTGFVQGLGVSGKDPEAAPTSPVDVEITDQDREVYQVDGLKASASITDRKIQAAEERIEKKLRAELRAEAKAESVVTSLSSRLFNRFPEFKNTNHAFSRAVDAVFVEECRELGHTPQKGTPEFLNMVRAIAMELEIKKPQLRDPKHMPRRTAPEGEGGSNLPFGRDDADKGGEDKLPPFGDKERAILKKMGLKETPERILRIRQDKYARDQGFRSYEDMVAAR
jgi:hypothetical protein